MADECYLNLIQMHFCSCYLHWRCVFNIFDGMGEVLDDLSKEENRDHKHNVPICINYLIHAVGINT